MRIALLDLGISFNLRLAFAYPWLNHFSQIFHFFTEWEYEWNIYFKMSWNIRVSFLILCDKKFINEQVRMWKFWVFELPKSFVIQIEIIQGMVYQRFVTWFILVMSSLFFETAEAPAEKKTPGNHHLHKFAQFSQIGVN